MSTMTNRVVQGASFALAGGLALYAWKRLSAMPVSFRNQVVVITGGSRGLGLEMARQWCAEGACVAICSRTAADIDEAVEELQSRGGQAFGQACDVTDPASIATFVTAVIQEWGQIDVLVNNAGIIQVGPRDCMTPKDYQLALDTHFWGPFHLVEAVLPSMLKRKSGRIVNISSIGGRISVPHLLPYVTSKFALVGWSQGLTAELRQHGIHVTTVTPGLMRTGSPRNALFKGRHRAEYAWFSIGDGLPLVSVDSTTAAQRIIEACRSGKATAMVSAFSSLVSRSHGLLPGTMTNVMAFMNGVLPGSQGGTKENRKGWDSESAWSPSFLTILNERAAVRNREV